MPDHIIIKDMKVQSRIGITAEERSKPQPLLITLEISYSLLEAGRSDNLRKTIDYADVAHRVRLLAERRERNLIETLAEETAQLLLKEFRADAVKIGVKKFILPDTEFVSVNIERTR